ncbi:MAG: hypothetical protein R3B72_01340 [Polyangiaceae bacterium]
MAASYLSISLTANANHHATPTIVAATDSTTLGEADADAVRLVVRSDVTYDQLIRRLPMLAQAVEQVKHGGDNRAKATVDVPA